MGRPRKGVEKHTFLAMYNEIASAQNSHEIYLSKKAKSKMRKMRKTFAADQQDKLLKIAKWK